MLASTIVCQLSPMGEKKIDAGLKRAKKRRESAVALVPAPVDVYHGPLVCDMATTVVKVNLEPVDVVAPRVSERLMNQLAVDTAVLVRLAGAVRTFRGDDGNHSNRENDQAATRAQAAMPNEYGPDVRVAALVVDGETVRRVIFEGTLAAVRQALPDQATVINWKAAGVAECVAWDINAARQTIRWVPLEQAPKPLQVELETRGLAARVARL